MTDNPLHVVSVCLRWDSENSVWFMESSNVPGLSVESGELKTCFEVIGDVVDELIAANCGAKQ